MLYYFLTSSRLFFWESMHNVLSACLYLCVQDLYAGFSSKGMYQVVFIMLFSFLYFSHILPTFLYYLLFLMGKWKMRSTISVHTISFFLVVFLFIYCFYILWCFWRVFCLSMVRYFWYIEHFHSTYSYILDNSSYFCL